MIVTGKKIKLEGLVGYLRDIGYGQESGNTVSWNTVEIDNLNETFKLTEDIISFYDVEKHAEEIFFHISSLIKQSDYSWHKNNTDYSKFFDELKNQPLTYFDTNQGKKEEQGKTGYSELDWDYIDAMAYRMNKNDKYPPGNWKKPIDIKKLAESAIRHARKILQEVDGDEESLQDHAIALGCNGQMINYQLKNK